MHTMHECNGSVAATVLSPAEPSQYQHLGPGVARTRVRAADAARRVQPPPALCCRQGSSAHAQTKETIKTALWSGPNAYGERVLFISFSFCTTAKTHRFTSVKPLPWSTGSDCLRLSVLVTVRVAMLPMVRCTQTLRRSATRESSLCLSLSGAPQHHNTGNR